MPRKERKLPTFSGVREPTLTGKAGFKGASVVHSRLPSGAKLVFKEDEEAILQFLGSKDIQDSVPDSTGPVIYLIWQDGKLVVNTAMGYAMSQVPEFKVGHYYYLHCQAEIELVGRNALKDMEIYELGKTADEIECEDRVFKGGKMVLTAAAIREVNYERINYPRKKGSSVPPVEKQ